MTTRDNFDRLVSGWLAEIAPTREPEPLLGQVLSRTARTHRRPGWLTSERWHSVSVLSSRWATLPGIPARSVLLVALLLIILVAGVLLAVGARQQRTPAPPFGLAANGQITYSVDGDILAVDSTFANPRTVLSGPDDDAAAWFSPDGTRFAFVRTDAAGAGSLWVADADGSNARKLVDGFTTSNGWAEFAPAGDAVAVTTDDNPAVIRLVRADGGGTSVIQTGLAKVDGPIFRPPDGASLTFRGQATDGGDWGIYVVRRDGTELHRLDLDPGFQNDANYRPVNWAYYFQGPTWSADGTQLAYYTLEDVPLSPASPGFRIHVATIDGSGKVIADRKLEYGARTDDEFVPTWLPGTDGGILFQTVEGTEHRLWIGSTTGTTPARDLGVSGTDFIETLVSPDGTEVLATVPTGRADPDLVLIDLGSGSQRPVTLGGLDLAWQRIGR